MSTQILLLLCYVSNTIGQNNVTVNTNFGKIEGEIITLNNGFMFNAFRGIPFAKPPIEELRFAKPEAPSKWTETVVAKNFSSKCISAFGYSEFSGDGSESEDCLYLNIFAPACSNPRFPNGYPMLFWIHGGGFYFGSSRSVGMNGIGQYYVRKNVVVVTINYRLSVYGFFSTGDEAASGNWGLWDQTLALAFVRSNIGYFGGDPTKITVWGESAGAASVSLLSISNYSSGLFDQAIQASGSMFAPWASHNTTFLSENAKEFGLAAGCSTSDSAALVECVRSLSVEEIQQAEQNVGNKLISEESLEVFKFGPVRDGDFLPQISMDESVKQAPKKPSIFGTTTLEGGAWVSEIIEFQEELSEVIRRPDFNMEYLLSKMDRALLHLNLRNISAVKECIVSTYFNGDRNNKTYLLYQIAKFLSDVVITEPTYRDAKVKFEAGWPVWFYEFTYFREDWFDKELILKGAFHAMDLPYMFANEFSGMSPDFSSPNDMAVVENFASLFANFAKYGDPTPFFPMIGGKWRPFTLQCPSQYLLMQPQLFLNGGFRQKIMNFWFNIVPLYQNR